MSTLKPLDITLYHSIDEIMDACYEEFKSNFFSKSNKPHLKDREIIFSFNFFEEKADIFWHSASIEQKSNLTILPCTNSKEIPFCNNNCITGTHSISLTNHTRAKCIYRASRISWIVPIINMYNADDNRVTYWEKRNSKKRNRLYLRYQDYEIDYLIVFEAKGKNKAIFITAFPIFFVSAKKDYTIDYNNYIKNLSIN